MAKDILVRHDVKEEWLGNIGYVALQIDGIEKMETKPKQEYTKDEMVKVIKAFRRISRAKKEINKLIQTIEEEEKLNGRQECILELILDDLPKQQSRKEEKKNFYKKVFSDWFKEHI